MKHSVKILGTGAFIPNHRITNDDLAHLVDTNDEWIVTRTGISERRAVTTESTWSMAVEAAKEALENASLRADEVDLIIGATISSDFFYPSLACIVAEEIGAKNPTAIDVSAACSGFVYALDMARRYLLDEEYRTVLIVCAESLTRQTNYQDRGSCILFGDGAGAVVLGKGEGVFASLLKSEQAGMGALVAHIPQTPSPFQKDMLIEMPRVIEESGVDGKCVMNGAEVYKFAVGVVPQAIRSVCEKSGITLESLDHLVLHQANERIIEKVADTLSLPFDKFYRNIKYYGNTSAASIPICLHEMREKGLLKKGQLIALAGFGAGLTYAAAILEIC